MDSVFNDIEFLMENVKQEPAHANERAGPLAEDVQTTDTDTMPTYMTDFILDYINRSLKNEEDEVEAQPEYNETDGADGEESVEELIARAENMIRENTRQIYQANVLDSNTFATANEWLQQHNSQPDTSAANNPSSSGQSTNPTSSNYLTGPLDVEVIEVPYVATTDNVISVDTDSDDEVIFVNSNHPARPPGLRSYEVIDLSDQASPSDNLPPSPQRTETRKRVSGPPEIPVPVPDERVPEKQFRHSCAICLDDVKSPHSTICGHIYCGDCIKNALKIFKKCPTCNKKLKTSNVHPIYL